MKGLSEYLSMGFTIVGIFLLTYFIGTKTNKLALALCIGAICCLLFIINLIRKELK